MNCKAKEGHIVKMEVNFSGFPYPEINWFREGIEIQPSTDFNITTLNNKSFLIIKEVFIEDAGTISVRASNQFGMAECKAILAVVEDPNKVKESPPQFAAQMRDLSIQIGEPATFDVEIIGQPRPDVYWTKNGNRLGPSARYKFILEQNHVTLLIYEVQTVDQGVYECVVTNRLGRTSCSARLVVVGQPAPPMSMTPHQPVVAPELLTPLKD
jgi:titin